MTKPTTAALVALAALTIHYSVLSIVLHSSLRSRLRYHPSLVVLLTELTKVILSAALVFWNGELRTRVRETREMSEVEEVLLRRSEDVGIPGEQGDTTGRHSELSGREKGSHPLEQVEKVPIQKRRGSPEMNKFAAHGRSTSLRVNVTVAQNQRLTVAVVPPTGDDTPGIQHLDQLLLDRIDEEEDAGGAEWGDVVDVEYWSCLRRVVLGPGYWKLAIPSLLFAFQSNAQYFASANLSVPTFQLAYQLKIPATAVFSILLLKRSLNLTQWISLFSLTLGVGIVQLHSLTPSKSAATALAHPVQNHTLGLIAVIAACLSSGFATTYFERLLKLSTPGDAPPPSVWIRNIQLSLFGICIGLPVVWYEVGGGWGVLDRIGTGRGDVFQGFNGLTLVVILLQSTGGLLAALVMQYADNILKCFSTSLSILLSFVASIYLFSFQVSSGVALGAGLVILSTWIYAHAASNR